MISNMRDPSKNAQKVIFVKIEIKLVRKYEVFFFFTEHYHFNFGWGETIAVFIWPAIDEIEGFLEKSVRTVVCTRFYVGLNTI